MVLTLVGAGTGLGLAASSAEAFRLVAARSAKHSRPADGDFRGRKAERQRRLEGGQLVETKRKNDKRETSDDGRCISNVYV